MLNTFAPPTAATKAASVIPTLSKKTKIVVIGAGAFGGWTSYYLQQKGFQVTLVDAWGAGHSRSSSGDETRVIRSTYGGNELYFDLNVRALELWKENQKVFDRQLFYNTGVLWFCYTKKTPLVEDSIPFAIKHGMMYEYLSPAQLQKKYPLVNTADLHHAYFDPYGGYLKARESCQAVVENFIKQGGKYQQASVLPPLDTATNLNTISLSNGSTISADIFVFACGAWLGKIFPNLLQDVITCSKQEVYYFGVPQNQAAAFDNFPAWIDVDGQDFYYGISGNAQRGFKIGVDKRGEKFDPTTGERVLNTDVLLNARKFLTHRFPALKNAPLVENRVCPYENSPDGNFIFDVHPTLKNVVILGGGSGHGFKHGPALGELVADVLAGEKKSPALFSIK